MKILIDEKLNYAKAYVDGSFRETDNSISFGVVFIWNNKIWKFSQRLFGPDELLKLRNVSGELMGSMYAMKVAKQNNINKLTIFHDYIGISKWAKNEWKANLPTTQKYKTFFSNINKDIDVDFVWVKGHSKDKYNELADHLATNAIKDLIMEK